MHGAIRSNRLLLLILAATAALRLFWVLHAQTVPPDTHDAQWYYAVASELASGHSFSIKFNGTAWVSGPGGNTTTIFPPG